MIVITDKKDLLTKQWFYLRPHLNPLTGGREQKGLTTQLGSINSEGQISYRSASCLPNSVYFTGMEFDIVWAQPEGKVDLKIGTLKGFNLNAEAIIYNILFQESTGFVEAGMESEVVRIFWSALELLVEEKRVYLSRMTGCTWVDAKGGQSANRLFLTESIVLDARFNTGLFYALLLNGLIPDYYLTHPYEAIQAVLHPIDLPNVSTETVKLSQLSEAEQDLISLGYHLVPGGEQSYFFKSLYR